MAVTWRLHGGYMAHEDREHVDGDHRPPEEERVAGEGARDVPQALAEAARLHDPQEAHEAEEVALPPRGDRVERVGAPAARRVPERQPSLTVTCRHMPSLTVTCRHMQSHAVTRRYTPSPAARRVPERHRPVDELGEGFPPARPRELRAVDEHVGRVHGGDNGEVWGRCGGGEGGGGKGEGTCRWLTSTSVTTSVAALSGVDITKRASSHAGERGTTRKHHASTCGGYMAVTHGGYTRKHHTSTRGAARRPTR